MTSRPAPALARPIDLTYPSNRAAVIGAGVILAASRWRGEPWVRAAGRAGTGFVAWATARELDPDHPDTAMAALVLAAVVDRPTADQPLAAFGVLSALRVLADTTGETPVLTDHVGLLVQTALTARMGSRATALLPGFAAVARSGPWSRALPLAGVLVPPADPARAGWRALLPVLAALAVGPALTRPEDVFSECDRAPRTVRATDVRRARIAGVAALAVAAVTRRPAGLVPLAAAVLSVGLRRVRTHL